MTAGRLARGKRAAVTFLALSIFVALGLALGVSTRTEPLIAFPGGVRPEAMGSAGGPR